MDSRANEGFGVRAGRFVFGDRVGAAIFVGALVFFGLYWSMSFFTNDSFGLANVLVNLAEGNLHLDRIQYGPPSRAMPGVKVIDGQLYGRNYGQAILTLPVLFALRGASLVVDARLLLIGGWCLGLLFLVTVVGERVGRGSQAALLGSGSVALVFVVNAGLATDLDAELYPLVALQLTSAVAAAFVPVVLYRLLTDRYDERIGTVAGVGTFLSTPVGFWATIPKRHSVTALFVVLAMFTFYLSRRAEDPDEVRRLRALSYAWVGVTTWIIAAEGLVLLVALGTVDVLTARKNGRKELLLVALVLGVSLVPFFVTNLAVTGNPVLSPRMADADPGSRLQNGTPVTETPSEDPAGGDTDRSPGGGDGATGGGGSDDAEGGGGPLSSLVALVGLLLGALRGVFEAVTDLERIGHVFVRWGYVAKLEIEDLAVNLSVAESMPLLAVVTAVPVLAGRQVRRVRTEGLPGLRRLDPARQVDLMAGLYVVLLIGLYLPHLPIHHMFTVRYLHALYPIGVYGLARFRPVRRVVENRPRFVGAAYVLSVLASVAAFVAAIYVLETRQSEAVQLYANAALAIAGGVGLWATVATVWEPDDRLGAVVLAVGSAVVTAYLLVTGVEVFSAGENAFLPVVRYVAESIRVVTG